MLKQTIISSVALAMATLVAAPSAYAQAPQAPSVTVSLDGLDANSEAGARIMLQRIRNAAGQVCGGQPSLALDRQMKFQPCVAEVTRRTVDGMNNRRLTALLEKAGGPPPRAVASAR